MSKMKFDGTAAIPFATLMMFAFASLAQHSASPSKNYLSQGTPGLTPSKFAPDLVSLPDQHEFGSVFSQDGDEFYYGVDIAGKAEVRYMKLSNGTWTRPETILSHHEFSYNDPMLSPDENRLYFISNRPMAETGQKKDYDIWYVQRNGDRWSAPINAGEAINSDRNEYYISFADNGAMYFSSNRKSNNYEIYHSPVANRQFLAATPLSDSINTPYYEADVFVSPDESYLIFCADRPEGYGKGDLYISFKKKDGSWTTAKNMGGKINTAGHELCPFVSHDGKYFFYTSNRDIYWVDALVINEMR